MEMLTTQKKIVLIAGFVLLLVVIGFSFYLSSQNDSQVQAVNVHADSNNNQTITASVDFNSIIKTIDPRAFSMVESGYGRNNANITVSQPMRDRLKALGPRTMRIDLEYETAGNTNSRIVCGSNGCPKQINGEDWVNAVRQVGAEPVLIVPFNVVDAAGLVRYFNITKNNHINRWIVWNEPDNHQTDATTYSNKFNQIYDAMKAVDPTIKVGGPANSHFNTGFINTFLEISGSRTDFIDYHDYGQGGPGDNRTEAQLLNETTGYATDLMALRQMIQTKVPARASQIEIQIGEWNLDWDSDIKLFQHFNTIWSASALGNQLKGGITISYMFADKNGSLGALYEYNDDRYKQVWNTYKVNDSMPVYIGITMFTGNNLFRRFGTSMVKTTSPVANLELFASNTPHNIVVVNKDPLITYTVNLSTIGVSDGPVEVWQKNSALPVTALPLKQANTLVSGGKIILSFPPYSVTTLLLPDQTVTSIPLSSAPSPTPTGIVPSKVPSLTSSPTAVPTPVTSAIGIDTFTRTVTNGWGTADKGGKYIRIYGNSADYLVNGAAGVMNFIQSSGIRGQILGTSTYLNTETLVKVHISELTSPSTIYAGLILRRSTTSYYASAVGLQPSGNVVLKISKFVNNKETVLSPETTISEATFKTGIPIWIKSRVTGSRPSSVQMKIWNDGQPEPSSWQITLADRETLLQDAGTVGLTTSINSPHPLSVFFDSYSVTKLK